MPAQLATIPMSATAVDRMFLQVGDARVAAMADPATIYTSAPACFAEPDGYNALHGWSFAQD